MDEKQVFAQAQQMFLADRGRKDVIDFMIANGIDEERSEVMATEAFKSIRDQRRAMVEEQGGAAYGDEGGSSGGGIGSVILGLVFLIGGVVATMSSDSIWYGAIIVGVITLFSGIAKMAN